MAPEMTVRAFYFLGMFAGALAFQLLLAALLNWGVKRLFNVYNALPLVCAATVVITAVLHTLDLGAFDLDGAVFYIMTAFPTYIILRRPLTAAVAR